MNRAVLNSSDMSVLERQRARMKDWLHEQDQEQQPQLLQGLFLRDEFNVFSSTTQAQAQQFAGFVYENPQLGDFVARAMKPDPGIENGWPDFGKFGGDVFVGIGCGSAGPPETNYGVSRTASCPPAAATAIADMVVADSRKEESVAMKILNSSSTRESFKKRKNDKNQNIELTAEDENKEKKFKGCAEEANPKNTEQNSNNSKSTTTNDNNNSKKETSLAASMNNSKVSEVQKPDYIHVRARRGQATDSHSLAERVRREKISERMKYLQDLVPGCNKITGKAGMLDEIINYVQSLQIQVEFLSMKLAAVNPRLDFNIDNLFPREIFPACTSSYSAVGASSDIGNPPYQQFNPSQEVVSYCGLEMGMHPIDIALRKTISAPILTPETFLDATCFNQIQTTSTWDTELQNIYDMDIQQDR